MPRYTPSVCSHLRPLSSFSFPASLLSFSPLSSVPSFPFQEQKPCSKTVCESPALKQITSLGFWKPLGALQRMASEKHSAAATYEELPERPFSVLLPSSPLSTPLSSRWPPCSSFLPLHSAHGPSLQSSQFRAVLLSLPSGVGKGLLPVLGCNFRSLAWPDSACQSHEQRPWSQAFLPSPLNYNQGGGGGTNSEGLPETFCCL